MGLKEEEMWLFVFLMITTSSFFKKFYLFLLGSLVLSQFININIKNDLILDFKNPRKAHLILTLNFSLVSVP